MKKVEEVEEEVEEVQEEEQEEEAAEEQPIEEEQEEAQPQVQEVPIFPTQADVNRMIYANNMMLHQLLQIVQSEIDADSE